MNLSFARKQLATSVLFAAAVVLLIRVFLSLLFEYRFYFPPNFTDSFFLLSRRDYFFGWYSVAFYAHIISSPLVLLGATYLVVSGGYSPRSKRRQSRHRLVGRWVGCATLLLVLPSGFAMAVKAQQGPVAGTAFAVQGILTGAAMILAVHYARARWFPAHRAWSIRCYILLISPLFLRLANGLLLVFDLESSLTLNISSWTSWVVPLVVTEFGLRRASIRRRLASIQTTSKSSTLTEGSQ